LKKNEDGRKKTVNTFRFCVPFTERNNPSTPSSNKTASIDCVWCL
jgi:hypothetical protein